MQDFIVSARKYRPTTFATVVGQDHITSTLRHAVSTRHLAQAFLFCGPRGVGKTTCARILAKTINCENLQPEGEACSECTSCLSFQHQNSLNIHELDAASNNSVDDIRQLTDQVRIPPQYGRYKVYIIDEVHMLSTQAFNAFLKTLEEPPPYAIFILATTEKHKIIPTILSRCQIFDFNRIRHQDISAQLEKVASEEGVEFDSEALLHIARKADGGLRDALSMFDMISTFSEDRSIRLQATLDNLHILDSDYFFKVIDLVLEGNTASLMLLFDDVIRKGFEGHHFLLGLAEHIRELILASHPATLSLLEQGDEIRKKLQEQSSRSESGFFVNLLSMASKAELQYRNSKNPRLLTELCLMKMAGLRQWSDSNAEKKKISQSADAFRNPEASIREVVSNPAKKNPEFRKTPGLGYKTPEPETSEESIVKEKSTGDTSEPAVIAECHFDFSKAKESYLLWLKEKSSVSVSNWSLTLKEEQLAEGYKLFFQEGSIAADGFAAEEKQIREFFFSHFRKSPNFEICLISEEASSLVKPYSNTEKFRYLEDRYPGLAVLKNKLNLEIN